MNKKKIRRVFWILIVLAVFVGGVIFLQLIPKIILKNRIDKLVNGTYTYKANIFIDRIKLDGFGDELSLDVTGEKGSELLYGRISSEEFNYMDVYVDSDYEMIFDAKPFIESMIDAVGNKIGFSLGFLSSMLGDMNVSLEQLEYIVDKDILTVTDTGISSEVFKGISGEQDLRKLGWVLKYDKNAAYKTANLDDSALYFTLESKEDNLLMIIGIPKASNDNKIWLFVDNNGMRWSADVDYKFVQESGLEMPEETFTEDQLKWIKEIYKLWKKEKTTD